VRDPLGLIGAILLAVFVLVAVFGDRLAPHSGEEEVYDAAGRLARLQPPSGRFLFGTTQYAKDVLSQTILGTRVAILVGVLSAAATVFVGFNVGLIAGYLGGWVDDLIMRIVDITYGIPFIPFAIILVSLLQPSVWNIILTISLLFWRTTARIIRAQVLTLKARPFVISARAAGAGPWRIMYLHIAPNVFPLALLYVALGVGTGVLTEAGLAFLGFGDPRMVSWGGMLNVAFQTGSIRTAWWWVIPPGVGIALFVISTFLVGRGYEEIVNPRLRER
jgi:peptide/nickel transport system permease protein